MNRTADGVTRRHTSQSSSWANATSFPTSLAADAAHAMTYSVPLLMYRLPLVRQAISVMSMAWRGSVRSGSRSGSAHPADTSPHVELAPRLLAISPMLRRACPIDCNRELRQRDGSLAAHAGSF